MCLLVLSLYILLSLVVESIFLVLWIATEISHILPSSWPNISFILTNFTNANSKNYMVVLHLIAFSHTWFSLGIYFSVNFEIYGIRNPSTYDRLNKYIWKILDQKFCASQFLSIYSFKIQIPQFLSHTFIQHSN